MDRHFIQLTYKDTGNKTYIDADKIAAIDIKESGCLITFDSVGIWFNVRESADAVLRMIKNA